MASVLPMAMPMPCRCYSVSLQRGLLGPLQHLAPLGLKLLLGLQPTWLWLPSLAVPPQLKSTAPDLSFGAPALVSPSYRTDSDLLALVWHCLGLEVQTGSLGSALPHVSWSRGSGSGPLGSSLLHLSHSPLPLCKACNPECPRHPSTWPPILTHSHNLALWC